MEETKIQTNNTENKNSFQQENSKQNPKKETRLLNWRKYLYDENLPTNILKFEEWDRKNLDFEEASVLKKDLTRTRAKDPFFQKPKTQKKLQELATFYCQQHFVNYQQGMLELIIPFLLLQNPNFKLSKCYAYFVSFMNNYFPKFLIQKPFNDNKELPFLTSALYFCELLLKYHNPRIFQTLKEADVDLSMGITQWIITLFAKETDIQLVYIIFDLFMKKQQPLFIFYLIIQVIISQEQKIYDLVQEDTDLLLMFFNKNLKDFKDEDDIYKLFQQAEKLQENTPKSFEIFLKNQGFTQKQVMSQNEIEQLIDPDQRITFIPVFCNEFLSDKSMFSSQVVSIDLTLKDKKIPYKQKGQPKYNPQKPKKLLDFIINKIDPETPICLVPRELKSQEDKKQLSLILDSLQEIGKQFISVLIDGYSQLKIEIEKEQESKKK